MNDARVLLSDILTPVRSALLHSVLDDYAGKVSLDGAARVLTSDALLAESLFQWIENTHHDMPYSVTVPESPTAESLSSETVRGANAKTVAIVPDDNFTHAIYATLDKNDYLLEKNAILKVLKDIYYALKPKGFAIVMMISTSPFEKTLSEAFQSFGKGVISERWQNGDQSSVGGEELIDLAEEAQFERGKIRWTERKVAIKGDQRDELVSEMKVRLKKVSSEQEYSLGWVAALEAAISEEAYRSDELVLQAQLLLAMKWDLLCA